jgi:hypothetical protein
MLISNSCSFLAFRSFFFLPLHPQSYVAKIPFPYAMPRLSPTFRSAVLDLLSGNPTNDQYSQLVSTFGTHWFTNALFGAKFVQSSEFQSSGYASLLSTGIGVKAGAEASFSVFTGSASGATNVTRSEAQTFSQSASMQYETYIGSRAFFEYSSLFFFFFFCARSELKFLFFLFSPGPTNDGKWQTWAQSTSESPLIVRMDVRPLADLLTPGNFPEADPARLAAAAGGLRAYVSTVWCASAGGSCDGPAADRAIPVVYRAEGTAPANQQAVAQCDPGFTAISAGFAHLGGNSGSTSFQGLFPRIQFLWNAISDIALGCDFGHCSGCDFGCFIKCDSPR